jgi:hypothetical protein
VKCAQCQDHRFVCEVHPWLPFPHDACAGPGVPCPECQSPGDKPELPDGWLSYASTSDDPFDPQHWPVPALEPEQFDQQQYLKTAHSCRSRPQDREPRESPEV